MRRRRRCACCGFRFTTVEGLDAIDPHELMQQIGRALKETTAAYRTLAIAAMRRAG